MKSMTALIADDETNLRDYLRTRLSILWPTLEIVAEARNGKEALELIDDLKPDVVFLDIKMPGLTGLQVAAQMNHAAQVVFVTAFDDYAVEAFEQEAIDYLLKPVEDNRLSKTIERLTTADHPKIDNDKLRSLLDLVSSLESLSSSQIPGVQTHSGGSYLSWIKAGLRDETRIIPVNEIVYFRADQKYVTVRTLETSHLIRLSLKELELQLDPSQFWRIHRGTLVNVSAIEMAKKDFRGRFTLHLRNLRQTLKVSDSYTHKFRHM